MTEHTEKTETAIWDEEKEQGYNCSVDANLFSKLEQHIYALRGLEGKISKQSWLAQAIKEKLKIDRLSNDIPKEKRLHFFIEKKLSEEIEERVEFLKKFRSSYSKKQWVVEAIYQKLERDAVRIQEQLDQLKSEITDR